MSNIETKKKRIEDTIAIIDQDIDTLYEKRSEIYDKLTKKQNEYMKRSQELKSKGKNIRTNSFLKSQSQLIQSYKKRLKTLDNLIKVKDDEILKLKNKNEKLFFSKIPNHLKAGMEIPNVNETNNSIENKYLSGQNNGTTDNNVSNVGEPTQSQTVANRLGRSFKTLKNKLISKKSEGGRRKTRRQH
jgi:uncharacterized protein